MIDFDRQRSVRPATWGTYYSQDGAASNHYVAQYGRPGDAFCGSARYLQSFHSLAVDAQGAPIYATCGRCARQATKEGRPLYPAE